MKLIFSFVLLMITAIGTLCGQTVRREIENIILHDTDIEFATTPGFIIGIIDGDSTIVESFGSNINNDQQITTNDIFEVGSITKVFTALLLYKANEAGIIDINESVNNYLPIEHQNPRMDWLTIDHLVNHQSGLPRRPYGFGRYEIDPQNPYLHFSKDLLLKSYSIYIPEENKSTYSHMNYGLLEIIIENVYHSPFGDVLSQNILKPLNLGSTFINFKENKDIRIGGVDRSGKMTSTWDFASHAASEGLKINCYDLLTFIKELMKPKSSALDMNIDQIFRNNYPSFNEQITISGGWQQLAINNDVSILVQTGTTSGHNSFIGMNRDNKTGVVILSNSVIGTKDLGMLVLRMINNNWKRKS